jgi:hypothetical protein
VNRFVRGTYAERFGPQVRYAPNFRAIVVLRSRPSWSTQYRQPSP